MRAIAMLAALLLAASFAPAASHACSEPQVTGNLPASVAEWALGAQLLDGLGDSHRAISSAVPLAQRYFDQGLRLLWAFNHDEATRSFAAAARADPGCAICYWGVALTVGPNYNLPLLAPPRAKVAWEALENARANAARASAVERELIAALGARYASDAPLSGPALEHASRAYANAMAELAQHHRDDLDVQTLWAEALMNVAPWRLWAADGTPAAETPRILAILEGVMARDPHHPGANHYYVHAVEASPHPERGLDTALRLRGLMPGAGHLEHMPAHILQRVGRYNEAAEANRRGAAADRAYLAKTRPPDYYGIYTAHNYQFLAYSALMAGRAREALDAARRMREAMPVELLRAAPGYDWYVAQAYLVALRFEQWQTLLAEPEPGTHLPGLHAGYLYARGSALAATGKPAAARDALARLRAEAARVPADYGAGLNLLGDVLRVALTDLDARIARAEGRMDDAIALLEQAVAAEDRLAYDEPRAWFVPARQALGAALLEAGRPADAARAFDEDLARNPENGWSLFGLRAALTAQDEMTAAAAVARRLDTAWRQADFALTAARP